MNLIITCARHLEPETEEELMSILDDFGDSEPYFSCVVFAGYSLLSSDCNDDNALINPSALEICDGIDNDCNQLIDDAEDEALENTGGMFYLDEDGDGYGQSGNSLYSCECPAGYAFSAGDCDDGDELTHPDAYEIPNDQIDQDCDGEDEEMNGQEDCYWSEGDCSP